MRHVHPSPSPRHSYIVQNTDGIQEVFDRLKHGILAADTETSGLNWRIERVGALCFAAGDTAAFFCRDALGTAARWFADQVKKRRRLVFHSGKYDMHVIRETFGIHIGYPVHDTLTQSRLLDQRGVPLPKYPWFSYDHSLDTLAKHYVDEHASDASIELIEAIRASIAEITGDKRKHKNTMADWIVAPLKKSGTYGLRDPWYTLRLHDLFISMIQHWPQLEPNAPSLMSLYQNERWLTLALRDMEERGVRLDQEYVQDWIDEAQRRADKMRDKMNKRAGYDVKWSSNPQIREFFWEELGLEQIHGDKLDKRVLLRLDHPLAAMLLKLRKQSKMASAGRALLRNLDDKGFMHAWYNQNVDTGRMSAKDGVHQFARESGIRKGIKPRKGTVIRSADYSQIEMRFAAHFSREEVLIKGFTSGKPFDTHAALAARMFGVKKPSDGQRDRGKTMNFAMLYGAGEDAVTEQLIDKISWKEARRSCIELGHRPGPSESPFRSLAQLLRNRVRESYPRMWDFTKNEEWIAKQMNYVTDAYGYHRWLDEDEAYKAMNSKLQGSAAHKAKEGMVAVYRELQLGTGQLGIIMQVHDDVVYESDGDPEVDRRVLELLEDRTSFRVPMIADLKGSDKSWGEKETITLPKRRRRAA